MSPNLSTWIKALAGEATLASHQVQMHSFLQTTFLNVYFLNDYFKTYVSQTNLFFKCVNLWPFPHYILVIITKLEAFLHFCSKG